MVKLSEIFKACCGHIFSGNRSQVQGSTFRVKDKEGIKDPKSSLKMLIFPNNCQFGSNFWVRPDETDAFFGKYASLMQSRDENGTLNP